MVARKITVPVESDGRVTIPVAVRTAMGLKPGDLVELTPVTAVSVIIPEHPVSILDLAGILPPLDRFATDEDMREQIREATDDALLRKRFDE